jgi:hypothetical protein
MAQIFSASIYGFNNGQNSYDWNVQMGIMRGFPATGVTVETLRQPTAYSGVTCNSLITVLPTGLNVHGTGYYTPLTEDQIATLANA